MKSKTETEKKKERVKRSNDIFLFIEGFGHIGMGMLAGLGYIFFRVSNGNPILSSIMTALLLCSAYGWIAIDNMINANLVKKGDDNGFITKS